MIDFWLSNSRKYSSSKLKLEVNILYLKTPFSEQKIISSFVDVIELIDLGFDKVNQSPTSYLKLMENKQENYSQFLFKLNHPKIPFKMKLFKSLK